MPAGHEPAENTHLKMAKALKFKAFVGWVVETRRIELPTFALRTRRSPS